MERAKTIFMYAIELLRLIILVGALIMPFSLQWWIPNSY